MESFTLFSNIGQENINTEYKEFSFKVDINSYYTVEEVKEIVFNGTLEKNQFNTIILDNLNLFINYVPKYVSAFANSKDCKDNGKLFFGIDDIGEVTGIPFFGKLSEKKILKNIKKTIKEDVVTTDKTKRKILDNLKIKIHKCDINSLLFYSNIEEKIERKEEKYKQTQIVNKKYLEEWDQWYKELLKYSIKLKTLIDNKETLLEFIDYIHFHNKEKLIVLDQIDKIEELIINIKDHKEDENNIMYWLCRFRDENIYKIVLKKPKRIKTNMTKLTYLTEFSKLDILRERFLIKNKDINYFIVEINLLSNLEDEVFFRDKSKIIKKIRIEKFGEPISL
jgi:hypothetical protein